MALDVHGLREGGTYYMRVRAVRGGATGDFSPELTVTVAVGRSVCAAPPATPTSFETSTSGALVQLMWQPGTGAAPTGYMLYVGSAPGRQDYLTAPLGPIPALSATAGEGVYYLRLFAMNACGTSPGGVDSVVGVGAAAAALLSGGAASAPSTALPGAPESLTQQVIGQTVTLRWAPPSTGGAPTRYILEAMTAGGPVAVDTGAATGFTHPNTPSGTYVIRVRAANGRGVGPASAPVTVVVP